jgi:hypothetical protein
MQDFLEVLDIVFESECLGDPHGEPEIVEDSKLVLVKQLHVRALRRHDVFLAIEPPDAVAPGMHTLFPVDIFDKQVECPT